MREFSEVQSQYLSFLIEIRSQIERISELYAGRAVAFDIPLVTDLEPFVFTEDAVGDMPVLTVGFDGLSEEIHHIGFPDGLTLSWNVFTSWISFIEDCGGRLEGLSNTFVTKIGVSKG